MRNILFTLALIAAVFTGQAATIDLNPPKVLGVLKVKHTTEGNLLWLQGRVGEGQYSTIDDAGKQCSIDVPIAIGHLTKTHIGIVKQPGLEIAITNPELNHQLLSGKPVASDNWIFRPADDSLPADGYLVSGINPEESFVLNSRRRWISWLLNDQPNLVCQ
ncbi:MULTISPECIES: hypothetical protein [unclassified Agarivorans]|uniref:hypothetical protein n=1 Tax=unclassified Agarivorans TaxID=2636026 RepID=UPI0026E12ED3|nr:MULTISPECIES: hypothetical protein [unclassified Agarivorans]MDO6685882.1 hypothetical protein [Agarivorans sp. 3_MG-2023]MDO6713980.1 hypothetical protein [Agarivorans sp. 2_MG-2023]